MFRKSGDNLIFRPIQPYQTTHEPATDLVGDLRGRDFWEFERLLAVPANPEPLVERIADQFNPIGFFIFVVSN